MKAILVAVLPFFFCTMVQDDPSDNFKAPKIIRAGEAEINVDVGHSAPCVYDFDGDGVKDLLVGQFGEGKLRIYRNVGSNKEPKFKDFEWFNGGTEKGRVPTG